MNRILIALACLSLAACGSIRLTVAQGMYAAEAGAYGINTAAIQLAPSMTPAQRASKKAAVDKINQAVTAAHMAYIVGNQTAAAANAKTALTAIATEQQGTRP